MTAIQIRLRLIKMVREKEPGTLARAVILKNFQKEKRGLIDAHIARLISEGIFIVTGLGKRGSPEVVSPAPNCPQDVCPTCNRQLTWEDKQIFDPTAGLYTRRKSAGYRK